MSFIRWLCILLLASIAPAAASQSVILVLGDSLSAAHGMGEQQGWVHLLQERLDENGYPHTVVNASVSGDTTRDALSRLDSTIERHRPDIAIVELGGNDGLRAFPIDTIDRSLSLILEKLRENGAKIVLAGMRMPPNYGPVYTQAFEALYPRIADEFQAALIPFFMEEVATNPDFMQDDGIHPNAAAQPLLLDKVWPVLESLLDQP
ncbi:MAG: arylesterase [Gammaproteobacteria bacterium]|nr:arylesterase [Gammaproteobacteria bacterium]